MAPTALTNTPPSSTPLSPKPSSTPPSPKPSTTHPPHHQALASQVLQNLQYQHDWVSLRTHTHSPPTPDLLRPLISGLPPQRVYVHPDEQVEMLKRGIAERDVRCEREWVLPTHVREKWSLRRLAEVFDAVGVVPPGQGGGEGGERGGEGADNGERGGEGKDGVGSRRGGKRVLMAIVGDDSTVVYYIVHDGIVKPRQN